MHKYEDWFLSSHCNNLFKIKNHRYYFDVIPNPEGAKTQKGSLIAMIKGTKAIDIEKTLDKISFKIRKKVKTVSQENISVRNYCN